jgi:hypothetical protein
MYQDTQVEASLLAMIADSRRVVQLADQLISMTASDAPPEVVADAKKSLGMIRKAPKTLASLRALAIKERECALRNIEFAELQISTRRNLAALSSGES